MSDFLDHLGDELESAGRRRARRRPRFAFAWSRRAFALAVIAAAVLVSVPAVAVTGAFKQSRAPSRPDATQPGQMGAIGPPCVSKEVRKLQTTSDPPPMEVLSQLAVLRRPQRRDDQLTGRALEGLAHLPVDAVNPASIRLAGSIKGTRIYLVPAANVRYFPPLPDTEGCNRFDQPNVQPKAGVCLVERRSAATCNDIDAIRRGLTMLTSGGSRHGLTRVAGIAPDGVRAIIWRVHRGKGFLDTRIAVRNNVYAADVPGRAGHGLYVFWETPSGRKLVRGPHKFTKKELAAKRRDKALDEHAGQNPTVFPPRGRSTTIFTLRMKVPPKNKIYVAKWTAPAGTTCVQAKANDFGLLPALKGPLAGLLKGYLGPPGAGRRWCPGRYEGTVRTQRYRNDVNGPVVGRFSFEVVG